MADVLGHSNLYGYVDLTVSADIFVYASASLDANAILYAAQGSVKASTDLLAEANVSATSSVVFSARVQNLYGTGVLNVTGLIFHPADLAEAHLTCQSSVVIIPNVVSSIKEGQAVLDCNSFLNVDYDIVSYGSCHLYVANEYSPGYWETGYVASTNLRATANITIFGGSIMKTTSGMLCWLSMDWTRNNTWKIGQICMIQQQLLEAVLKMSKDGNDHLVADDVQPLFQDYDKLIFEVQDV